MNSRTLASTARFSRGSQIRAQYSPVFRRASQTALARHSLSNFSARASADVPTVDIAAEPETPVLADNSLNEFTRSTSDRWWDPHLIDRLQSPLTRYHD